MAAFSSFHLPVCLQRTNYRPNIRYSNLSSQPRLSLGRKGVNPSRSTWTPMRVEVPYSSRACLTTPFVCNKRFRSLPRTTRYPTTGHQQLCSVASTCAFATTITPSPPHGASWLPQPSPLQKRAIDCLVSSGAGAPRQREAALQQFPPHGVAGGEEVSSGRPPRVLLNILPAHSATCCRRLDVDFIGVCNRNLKNVEQQHLKARQDRNLKASPCIAYRYRISAC